MSNETNEQVHSALLHISAQLERLEERLARIEGSVGGDAPRVHPSLAEPAMLDAGASTGVSMPDGERGLSQANAPTYDPGRGTRIGLSIVGIVVLSLLALGEILSGFFWLVGAGFLIAFAMGAFTSNQGRTRAEEPEVRAPSEDVPTSSSASLPQAPRASQEIRVSVVLGRVGIAIILFGMVTLFTLVSDVIGPLGRVSVGIIVALAALVLGERAARSMPQWSWAVTGGGLALLYGTLYVAYMPGYELLPRPIAFVLLVCASVLAGALALRYESHVVAGFALVGAFLVPLLMGSDVPQPLALATYLLVLDGAVLWLALIRPWGWIRPTSAIATLAFLPMILAQSSVALAAILLAVVSGFHLASAALPGLFGRRRTPPAEAVVFIVTALVSVGLAWDRFHVLIGDRGVGIVAAGLGLALAAMAWTSRYVTPRDTILATSAAASGIALLTIAIPLIAGDAHRATIVAWALVGAGIAGIAKRSQTSWLWVCGVFMVSLAGILLLVNTGDHAAELVPVFNARVVAFLAVALAIAAIGRFAPDNVATSYAPTDVAANVVILALVSLEAWSAFAGRYQLAGGPTTATPFAEMRQQAQVALSISWTLYALILLGVGIARRIRWARIGALGLLAVTVGKVFIIDTAGLESAYRLMLFLVVGVLLVAASYAYQRFRPRIEGEGAQSPGTT